MVVMTLDAGGTNFVFSALCDGEEIIPPIILSSNAHDLELCLKTIVNGFTMMEKELPRKAVAISFAFPGPSDYKNGVIGDLTNFPSFRNGVALGPYLEDTFDIPVFINNDGDLFTLGEAINGFLPYINTKLKENGVNKTYKNLIGITLGTGFGCGIVTEGKLLSGDNSAAGEIWLTRNYSNLRTFAEEGVSIRALTHSYQESTGLCLSPKEIYEIALGMIKGNKKAAEEAFEKLAIVVAESLCHVATIIDGLIVIGGGISGAYQFILPKIVDHMNGYIEDLNGNKIPRLLFRIFNAEDHSFTKSFLGYQDHFVNVPFSNKRVLYDLDKRSVIGISRLGTSKAISLGAYTLAVQKLEGIQKINSKVNSRN